MVKAAAERMKKLRQRKSRGIARIVLHVDHRDAAEMLHMAGVLRDEFTTDEAELQAAMQVFIGYMVYDNPFKE
jgi:hypothetical protein